MVRGKKTVVLVGGTFDILHLGHLKYLEKCKKQGDILVVCVAGDARTQKRKGANRPIMPAIQRAEIVASLKMVDLAFVSNRKPFSEPILHSLRPNVLVTSSNEPSGEVKQQFLEYMKRKHPEIRVTLTHRSHSASSSSKLINKLKTPLRDSTYQG
jgi:rfaE bifunctional protein nucleotidyltransferase chain/domain